METEISKNCLPSDKCNNTIRFIDHFFDNKLYNSCQATDELIKSIEESQDEALARRVLALYQNHYSKLERPWQHVTFIYGLGLIYMHFNAYNWAIKAFREAIYVEPSFARSRDVHTRLGLIFKANGHYKLSEKHFNLAINDTRPNSGTSTKLELEFHLAHLLEIQGKFKQAKEAYERLLQKNDLPHQLSANIHRQLGWMCFCTDGDTPMRSASGRKQNMLNHHNPSSSTRMNAALNYLNTSYQTDSDSKTSYYLGRCFTNIGKFQEAFDSYRSVIDREESTADTWCSIGVLYHQQKQHTDALQAYVRSVQYDKQHSVAWTNLGILYESHNQFHDALKCYQHVLRSSSNGVDRSLQARIKFIQKQLADIETSLSNNGKTKINSDKLLSLEDLWNLESKSGLGKTSNNIQVNSTNNKTELTNTTTKKMEITSNSNIIPPQVPTKSDILLQPVVDSTLITANIKSESNGPIENNCTELKPSSPSLLKNNCANKIKADTHPPTGTTTTNHTDQTNDCKLEIPTQGSNDLDSGQSLDSKNLCLSNALTNGASKDSGISSNSSTYTDCALASSQNTNVSLAKHISAEQVIEACKNSPKSKKFDVNVLNDEEKPPHTFPKPPPYPALPQDKLFPSPPSIFMETKKDLLFKRIHEFCHSSPISILRNLASVLKLDLGLFSTKTLVENSPDDQIDIYSHLFHHPGENFPENITNFWDCERQKSSSTISRYANYQVTSFRESLQEERDSNPSLSKANLTKESETDSNESASNKKSTSGNQTNTDQAQHSNQASNSGQKSSPNKKLKKEPPRVRYVKSAFGIDLSDEKKWRAQLNELNKLPPFIKCVSASNMLTHIGVFIPGVNTTAMSMHVPGCRTLGNGIPNNFCSVNINVGPGDYEWCATSPEYGSIIARLCNRNGFEFDGKNWWPKLSDLQKYNVPVYRFTQRPGDLVWVNSGTFYWVQSTGWCNNIYWSVGPLCVTQYKSALESFELNKLLFRKSDVPLVQLTWNIVININIIPDDDLCPTIIDVLRRSLKYCVQVKDLVEESKQKICLATEKIGPNEAKFCKLCESEVFNISFIRKSDKNLHCIECARRYNPSLDSYEIVEDYDLKYLMKLYDGFIETRKKYKSCSQAPQQDQQQR